VFGALFPRGQATELKAHTTAAGRLQRERVKNQQSYNGRPKVSGKNKVSTFAGRKMFAAELDNERQRMRLE